MKYVLCVTHIFTGFHFTRTAVEYDYEASWCCIYARRKNEIRKVLLSMASNGNDKVITQKCSLMLFGKWYAEAIHTHTFSFGLTCFDGWNSCIIKRTHHCLNISGVCQSGVTYISFWTFFCWPAVIIQIRVMASKYFIECHWSTLGNYALEWK